MTTTPSATLPAAQTALVPGSPRRGSRLRSKILNRSKLYLALYLLMMPTILSMIVFSYYPKADVIIKAFYNWTPGDVEEYIGVKNFLDAAADPIFWQSFKVVAILLVANLFKMWPGIIVAIAMHRLISNRWRYIYQVLFVIPMVIPGLVWLLIWKSFYEPDFGLLNKVLNMTGIMSVLAWLDGTKLNPGFMPTLAANLKPFITGPVAWVFGSVWMLVLMGAMILTFMYSDTERSKRLQSYLLILAFSLLAMIPAVFVAAFGALVGLTLWATVLVAGLIVMARVLGTSWVIWPFWTLFGVWALWGGYPLFHLPVAQDGGILAGWNQTGFAMLRLPLTIIVAASVAEIARHLFDRLTAPTVMRWIGMSLIAAGSLLVIFGMIWTDPVSQFTEGTPAWLGNKSLVLPAIIFWGFPWVGVVGVLIYLAGLQQISQDVYEAAELDGVGPIGRTFRIELPLIMTQVRINLIFMTIGTLTGYEFFLILLGPSGGPGNVGVVPGLYMYSKAFSDGKFGYACALGMIMFFMILLLTIIYQRYVKVDK